MLRVQAISQTSSNMKQDLFSTIEKIWIVRTKLSHWNKRVELSDEEYMKGRIDFKFDAGQKEELIGTCNVQAFRNTAKFTRAACAGEELLLLYQEVCVLHQKGNLI